MEFVLGFEKVYVLGMIKTVDFLQLDVHILVPSLLKNTSIESLETVDKLFKRTESIALKLEELLQYFWRKIFIFNLGNSLSKKYKKFLKIE